jgi:hypothetical protein
MGDPRNVDDRGTKRRGLENKATGDSGARAEKRAPRTTVATERDLPPPRRISNYKMSAAWMRSHGYRRVKAPWFENIVEGGEAWVHSSGKHSVLQWDSASGRDRVEQVASPNETSSAEKHPLVAEARGFADGSEELRDENIRLLSQLKEAHGRSEYPRLHQAYWDQFAGFQEDLNWKMDEVGRYAASEPDPQVRQALAEQAARLEHLAKWKTDEWPQMQRDLYVTEK